MPVLDCLMVIGVSLMSSLIAEGISWALIYRTDEYKRMKENILRNVKKLEHQKAQIVTIEKQKSHDQKVSRIEAQLKSTQSTMNQMKFKSTIFLVVIMVSVFAVLGNLYDGVIIAKLPFTPFGFVQNMSHRNLPGEDATDAAFVLIYMLSSFGTRGTIQKLLGFEPPTIPGQEPSIFAPPPSQS